MLVSYITAVFAMNFVSFGLAWGNIPCNSDVGSCPRNMICVPKDSDCTDLDECGGICSKRYPSCGGFRIHPQWCDEGSDCLSDPRFTDTYGFVADLPGICISQKVQSCDDIGAPGCPRSKFCYDDPRDDCNPYLGDQDCPGICL